MTNHLNPNWLAAFVAIAEGGAVAAAAQRLHRTPSAISVQLAQLESTLAARLCERTTRSMRLTAAGEAFLPYARRLLELEQAAIGAVHPPVERETLRIGLTEYFAPQRFDALLELLRRETGGARLEVAWGRSAELLARWSRGTLEMAVVTASEPPQDASALSREPLCWVAAPSFDAGSAAPLPLVLLSDNCPVREQALGALRRRARSHEIRLECSGSQAVIAAVRAGWGVGCLNRSAVPSDLRDLTRDDGKRWPSPGRLVFHVLAGPAQRPLARALRAWAR